MDFKYLFETNIFDFFCKKFKKKNVNNTEKVIITQNVFNVKLF